MFCVMGLIGGVSQYCATLALSHAPAAAVCRRSTTRWLIWGSIIGLVVWGEWPTPPIIIGAAIVTLTRLYLLRAESRQRRPVQ